MVGDNRDLAADEDRVQGRRDEQHRAEEGGDDEHVEVEREERDQCYPHASRNRDGAQSREALLEDRRNKGAEEPADRGDSQHQADGGCGSAALPDGENEREADAVGDEVQPPTNQRRHAKEGCLPGKAEPFTEVAHEARAGAASPIGAEIGADQQDAEQRDAVGGGVGEERQRPPGAVEHAADGRACKERAVLARLVARDRLGQLHSENDPLERGDLRRVKEDIGAAGEEGDNDDLNEVGLAKRETEPEAAE